MKRTLVFGLVLISGIVLGQEVKVYTLKSLKEANPDSVFSVDLSHEKLTYIPAELYHFTHIKTLNLTKNKLEFLPDSMAVFTALEVLNLSKNKFKFIPYVVFQVSSIKQLLLGQNTIEKIPDEIGQLIHLEVLDLYDNAVNDISPKLKELPSLKTLDIQGVMYNHAFHAKLVNDFRHCKLYLDPPCSCMDWIINNTI